MLDLIGSRLPSPPDVRSLSIVSAETLQIWLMSIAAIGPEIESIDVLPRHFSFHSSPRPPLLIWLPIDPEIPLFIFGW